MELKRVLANLYYPKIKALNTLVGSYTDLWLKEAEALASHEVPQQALCS